MEVQMPFAIDVQTRKIRHVDQVVKGRACNCICFKCEDPLLAMKGEIRQHYFKHDSINNCDGAQESALHKLAKQILVDSPGIQLPGIGEVRYQGGQLEKGFEGFIPDVSAKLESDLPIFFEIFNTSKVTLAKYNFYKTGQHKAIEINMKHCPLNSFEEIQQFIVQDIASKNIIFWEPENIPRSVETNNETNKHQVWPIVALVIIVVIFMTAWLAPNWTAKMKQKFSL